MPRPKGHKLSEETKAKMSAAKKKPRHLSEEHKAKLAAAQKPRQFIAEIKTEAQDDPPEVVKDDAYYARRLEQIERLRQENMRLSEGTTDQS